MYEYEAINESLMAHIVSSEDVADLLTKVFYGAKRINLVMEIPYMTSMIASENSFTILLSIYKDISEVFLNASQD